MLIGRLLQGFSAGVELGGVSVYLAEMATPGNKGFYVSWQSGSQQVAIMVAALIGYLLNAAISPEAMSDWGWRVPFFIGCMIVPFLFYIRRSLEETEEFQRRKHHPTMNEVFASLARNWWIVILGMLLVGMTTIAFYTITVYTPTFGKNVLKLSDTEKPSRDVLRRTLQFRLAARDGRAFRPHRAQADAARLFRTHIDYRLSDTRLAGQQPELSQHADGPALAIVPLRKLQRRDGGGPDRDRAGHRTHGRVFAGLLAGDRAAGRVYPARVHLADRADGERGGARVLAGVGRRMRPRRDVADLPNPCRAPQRPPRLAQPRMTTQEGTDGNESRCCAERSVLHWLRCLFRGRRCAGRRHSRRQLRRLRGRVEGTCAGIRTRNGNKLILGWGPSMGETQNAVPQRLARGEPIDVLIMVGYALDDLAKQGKVEPDSRVAAGAIRYRIGREGGRAAS